MAIAGFQPAAFVNESFFLYACPAPFPGWIRSVLRDDRPVQQQNVRCEGDPTEPSVQTAPEG